MSKNRFLAIKSWELVIGGILCKSEASKNLATKAVSHSGVDQSCLRVDRSCLQVNQSLQGSTWGLHSENLLFIFSERVDLNFLRVDSRPKPLDGSILELTQNL